MHPELFHDGGRYHIETSHENGLCHEKVKIPHIFCKKYLQKMLGLGRKKLNKDLIIMVSEL